MEVNDVGREEKCIEEEKEIIRSANATGEEFGWGKVCCLFYYEPFMQEFKT